MMSLSEYTDYDAIGLAQLVRQGEVSAKELKDTAVAGIQRLNPKLNAVVNILESEAEREMGTNIRNGPFAGVPFLIKELGLHAAGVPVNMGSRLAQGFTLPHDTELMARFRKSGLVTVGTTSTPEFGWNASTEAVLYGPTRNPWNVAHSAGGSSGGAAAAVASGLVPFAHASDAGGSIRIPASCCGLFGLKPSRGRVPMGPDFGEVLNGLAVEFAVTRSVRDAAALLDAVEGPDTGAPYWCEPPKRSFLDEVNSEPGKLRIAWTNQGAIDSSVDEECIEGLHSTVRLCEDLGHEVNEVRPEVAQEEFLLSMLRLWAANLAYMIDVVARFMERTASEDNLESANWACYEYGRSVKATELLEALEICNRISRSVGQFFEEHDLLLTPTFARVPPLLGTLNADRPGLTAQEWTNQFFTYSPFTGLANLTGQPAMSVPLCWSKDGLPIGMQFTARYGDEASLFRIAGQLEKASPWIDSLPTIHLNSPIGEG